MANYVFYDFETDSSNKFFGQIIEIGAILVNDDLEDINDYIQELEKNYQSV